MQRRSILLVGALVLAACASGTPEPTGPPLSATEEATARKLLQAAEVDPEKVSTEQRRRLVSLANEQRCPCPAGQHKGRNLAECADRTSCIRGPFAARAILRGLLRGEKDEKIGARLLERFGPREPDQIDLADLPCRGNKEAPVVMVVFSDFQCPFCSMASKLVEEVERHAKERLRVCFKHWPLTKIHPKAQLAAQAAAAAQLQGKFWPMHDKLFSNQKALDKEDLVEHATDLGLDSARFRQDLESAQVVERVARDAKEAGRLSLDGTPSFLINGRRMTDPKTVPDFLDWIAEAIALKSVSGKTHDQQQSEKVQE